MQGLRRLWCCQTRSSCSSCGWQLVCGRYALCAVARGMPTCASLYVTPRRACSSSTTSTTSASSAACDTMISGDVKAGQTGSSPDGSSGGSASRVPGKVRVHVTAADGTTHTISAPVGMTLMEAMRDIGKVDIEAACDGTCACSTCHVVFTAEGYRTLPSPPSEDELDMLDLAPAVTPTSRLSCQVTLTDAMDDIAVRIPHDTQNQMR